jgi:hypothetical protein
VGPLIVGGDYVKPSLYGSINNTISIPLRIHLQIQGGMVVWGGVWSKFAPCSCLWWLNTQVQPLSYFGLYFTALVHIHANSHTFTPPGLPHHIDSWIRLCHTNSHHFALFYIVSHHTHTQAFSHLGAAVPQTIEHIYWVPCPHSNIYPSACAHTNHHTISHHPTPLEPPDLFTPHLPHTNSHYLHHRNQSHFHHFDHWTHSLVSTQSLPSFICLYHDLTLSCCSKYPCTLILDRILYNFLRKQWLVFQ